MTRTIGKKKLNHNVKYQHQLYTASLVNISVKLSTFNNTNFKIEQALCCFLLGSSLSTGIVYVP